MSVTHISAIHGTILSRFRFYFFPTRSCHSSSYFFMFLPRTFIVYSSLTSTRVTTKHCFIIFTGADAAAVGAATVMVAIYVTYLCSEWKEFCTSIFNEGQRFHYVCLVCCALFSAPRPLYFYFSLFFPNTNRQTLSCFPNAIFSCFVYNDLTSPESDNIRVLRVCMPVLYSFTSFT